ncbi:hypothetical protein BDD18_4153 [Acidovorax temperans]|uniref:Uncharacterized protein n=1 Tax=Acidovorax temperans TaxID=80878 RepID=A0A543KWM7_9BURK|nr:hypothetical protein [Acidovorax temperans]TQM99493.1 hypothetical protein BDD18_4153 [Acidovorax temperans]
MTKSNMFSPGVRERAVRLGQEHRGEYLHTNMAKEKITGIWAEAAAILPKAGAAPG